MNLSDFSIILPYLKDDIYELVYFEVVFERQISIANVKTEIVNFFAYNKDELNAQIDEYMQERGDSISIADISIRPFWEDAQHLS